MVRGRCHITDISVIIGDAFSTLVVAERSFGIDGVHIAICTITKGLLIVSCIVVELLPRIPNMGWNASDVVVVAEEATFVLMDDDGNAEVFCRGKNLQFSSPGSISTSKRRYSSN